MPALANARHERFAQELAKGKSQAEAYESAGYKASRSAASRLADDVNICERVAEIQNRGAVRAEVTVESLLDEAAEIQSKALADKQYSAAIAALTAKAKLAGKWIERSESGKPGDFERMDDDELRAFIQAEAVALGAGSARAAAPGGESRVRGQPRRVH